MATNPEITGEVQANYLAHSAKRYANTTNIRGTGPEVDRLSPTFSSRETFVAKPLKTAKLVGQQASRTNGKR